MPRIFIRTITRPSTDVAWFTSATESDFTRESRARFADTGKCDNPDSTLSEDGLTLTKTITWATSEDYEEFQAFVISSTLDKEDVIDCETYEHENGIIRQVVEVGE